MGTLSGGGTHRVSIGARTLLGANAASASPSATTASSRRGSTSPPARRSCSPTAPLADGGRPVVKGADLSGENGILFRRNSSGAVEAVRRAGVGVTLNEALHA
jgi:2,3,4,5-tetrahydropyridine-2-carboxylate N-succinyltransferase